MYKYLYLVFAWDTNEYSRRVCYAKKVPTSFICEMN